jgi:transposase
VDFAGLPLDFHLTGGEASDSRQFETLLGIGPVIPYRSNAKGAPAFFPKALYRARARIEQAIGKLKRFKRVALRCEKTAENYAAIVAFACGLILVESVHTT